MAGIEHVPFRGSVKALGTAVIGSQVQWMFDAIPTMVENTKAASSDPIAMTPDEFAAHVRRDTETRRKWITEARITIDRSPYSAGDRDDGACPESGNVRTRSRSGLETPLIRDHLAVVRQGIRRHKHHGAPKLCNSLQGFCDGLFEAVAWRRAFGRQRHRVLLALARDD